jgi:hypothetical protein
LAAVNVHLTILSQSDSLLHLVRDFAAGLGCETSLGPARLRVELPDAEDPLLELLDYIALGTTKAGIDVDEPLCRMTYRRGDAPAEVTLELRITGFSLARPGADPAPAA